MTTRGRPKDEAARARILEAATELFIRDGYTATTMGAIADKADVAVKTEYAAFGSKLGLLEAVHADAARGTFGPTPFVEQDWVKDLANATSVQDAWAEVSERQVDVAIRIAPVMDVISCASSSPEVDVLMDQLKQSRHEFWIRIAEILLGLPGAKPEAVSEKVADVMDSLRSAETYNLLISDRGWTIAQWKSWTDDIILRELTPGD